MKYSGDGIQSRVDLRKSGRGDIVISEPHTQDQSLCYSPLILRIDSVPVNMLILTSIPYPRGIVVRSAQKKASWPVPCPCLRCIRGCSIWRKAKSVLPAVIETVDAIEHATYTNSVLARCL